MSLPKYDNRFNALTNGIDYEYQTTVDKDTEIFSQKADIFIAL